MNDHIALIHVAQTGEVMRMRMGLMRPVMKQAHAHSESRFTIVGYISLPSKLPYETFPLLTTKSIAYMTRPRPRDFSGEPPRPGMTRGCDGYSD